MPRTKQNPENGTPIEDARSPEEKAFDAAARTVAGKSRDITKAIRDWRSGDDELEDVILKLQLGQRGLQKAMNGLAAAHKTLLAASTPE